jgi:hypothetical protein
MPSNKYNNDHFIYFMQSNLNEVQFPTISDLQTGSIPDGYPLLCPFCNTIIDGVSWVANENSYIYVAENEPVFITNIGCFMMRPSNDNPLVDEVFIIHCHNN